MIRRFERDGESWSVEREGAEVTARREDKGSQFAFDSVEKASHWVEIAIVDRLCEGWTEVRPTLTGPLRNHRLEAAIVDDVENDAGWRVYADWLQSQGDRFGEWLALSLDAALADADPRSSGLWSTDLIWMADRAAPEAIARLEHRHGFVVRAKIGDAAEEGVQVPRRLLAALLHSPAARLLRSLAIEPVFRVSLVDVLLGERDGLRLEHLRELTLGDPRYRLSRIAVGELGRVFRACPSLETLHVLGSSIDCESAIEHSRLQNLTLEAEGLTGTTVAAIVRSSFPNLRRLELWLGRQPHEVAVIGIQHLRPLFDDDQSMVGLRELALRNCDFLEEVVQALVKSRRLTRLEHLDHSSGTLVAALNQ